MREDIDLYDKKILYYLDRDARMSANQIGKKIRRAKETVLYRIKSLQEKGIISYFYALINATELGYQYYKIYLSMEKATTKQQQQVLATLQKEPSCANIQILEGIYNMSFLTIQKNVQDLQFFLENLLQKHGEIIERREMHVLTASNKINQKILFKGQSLKYVLDHSMHKQNKKLDIIDQALIMHITRHARTPLTELAKKLEVEPRTLRYRLHKLEEEGIIMGYCVALNMKNLRPLSVQVDISTKNLNIIQSITEYFDKTNTCLLVYELLGKYDISVQLHLKDNLELKRILDKFKLLFADQYTTLDVFHIYKEYDLNWSPFKTKDI